MLVLGIETSCDETGVALFDPARGLLAERLHSQVDLHARYGGVVPELASRDHVQRLLPLVRECLADAGQGLPALDGIAYTRGPGLQGALLVGATFARTLAWSLDIPALGVHHMEGHLLAPLMVPGAPALPMVALLVSGGHSMLVRADAIGRYTLLGDSLDDAAGEAFDKTAKVLGLPYPGGPALARLADTGDASRFRLPRPLADRPGLDFSFSGLKTAVRQLVDRQRAAGTLDAPTRADIAAGFQAAIVDTLVARCMRALDATGLEHLLIAGGVSANRSLRVRLEDACQARGARLCCPPPALCTDNGAMIAFAGCQRLLAGEADGGDVAPRPRWPITALRAPGVGDAD